MIKKSNNFAACIGISKFMVGGHHNLSILKYLTEMMKYTKQIENYTFLKATSEFFILSYNQNKKNALFL